MLLISFISAVVLLESREVFQGMLSQPFVTALFLIWAGYDQNFVLVAATITHLIYLNRTPSGTTAFPEYPFGYFITASMILPGEQNVITLILSIALIILISEFTARFICFKRRYFEKHRERFLFYKGVPNLKEGIFFTVIIYFIFSLTVAAILKLISLGLVNSALYKISVPPSQVVITSLCIVPALFYIYKNFKIKK